jgi:16S rRNA (cytosine1402-N4)-methyltransferase
MIHKPVLIKEVIDGLCSKQDENFVDCTIGQGGHTKLILEKNSPKGKVLGIDLDPSQIQNCKENLKNFKDRLILVNDSYSNLKNIIEENNFNNISGVLLDLGFSSWQVDGSDKGFSFQYDEPLDMRYDEKRNNITAEIIINEWSELEIEKIFSEFGEEKFSKKIAKKIIEERKIRRIETTFELAEIIRESTPSFYWRGKIHYATRVFQALRIAVNKELENVERVLPDAISILEKGGRLVVISFHSLEDRIVKNIFKQKEKENIIKILNKKPITAGESEIVENPRSRSAKLRIAQKI